MRPCRLGVRAQGGARALSLFSGAGGLDIGLELVGWDVLAQVEMDVDCVGTLRQQAQHRAVPTQVVPARIEDVDPAELRSALGLRRGELTLLAGGPPCQPFTTSGLRQALSDRRANTLFPAYLGLVEEFSPRALLIENVDGMLSAALRHRPLHERGRDWAATAPFEERKGSFLWWFLDELVARGYAVAWGVVETADYGVPQHRQRAIVTAVKGDRPCWLPAPTHGGPGQPAFRTLGEALAQVTELGAVMPLSQRKLHVYRHIPAGGNWRDLPEHVQRATMGRAFNATGGKSGWWRRLAWDAPAPTILGMPDHSSTALMHPEELRCLSVLECAAAQSFPPHVRFTGRPRSQYQQVGNAVPPLLGAVLGEHLYAFLRGRRQVVPPVPMWRQASANRRPGTHGWSLPSGGYHLHVPVRHDHVWAEWPGAVSTAVPSGAAGSLAS
jgi:DNA (cytosine-5)-methyltransferase 1